MKYNIKYFRYFYGLLIIFLKSMRKSYFLIASKMNLTYLVILISSVIFSQTDGNKLKSSHGFWKNVQFGGGFGLNINSQFTEVNLAPGAIYRFNPKVAAGIGLQGSFISSEGDYSSALYGVSLISLINPVDHLQISFELEQLRVNRTLVMIGGPNKIDNFWNTGLFLGGGYGSDNVVVGIRYNLLYKETDYVYTSAMMPFIRIFF
jgi:hypothetical protein